MSKLMIYGANGFTGALVAREAVRRGQQPILAGRNATAVNALAQELQLDSRVFGLDDAGKLESSLAESRTS